MEQFTNLMASLLDAAKPALLVLLYSFLASVAVSFIASMFATVLDKIHDWRAKVDATEFGKRSRFDNYFFDLLEDAVIAVKSELVDRLKASSADGQLTKAEMLEAKNAAYDVFMASLPVDMKADLLKVAGEDVKAYVLSKIPVVVEMMKNEAKETDTDTDPQ